MGGGWRWRWWRWWNEQKAAIKSHFHKISAREGGDSRFHGVAKVSGHVTQIEEKFGGRVEEFQGSVGNTSISFLHQIIMEKRANGVSPVADDSFARVGGAQEESRCTVLALHKSVVFARETRGNH